MITNKTSIMAYGASDSGKSSQARYVAAHVWRAYRKKTRVIALDRGSLWSPCQDYVDGTSDDFPGEKIVIPLEFPTSYEFNPMAIMRKLRRGEWPEGGVINKPTAKSEKRNGVEEIKYFSNTIWKPWGQEETDTIGAVVVDSLTTFATSFMSDAKQKNVRSGNEAGSAPRTEEGETTGTNTQSHYGDCHTEILDAIQSFQGLNVHVSLFTALEGIGEDDSSGIKQTALGPDTVGKALNGKLPSKVNHCFHLVADGVGAKKSVKAWYNKHDSAIANKQWPAKVTLPPPDLAEFWKKWPNGYLPLSLEKGIGEFLEFLNRKKG